MPTTALDGLAQVNTLATHTALSAWSWGGDFLIVIVLFTVFFLFARYVGRGPFVGLLVALYAGYATYAAIPAAYTKLIPTAPPLTAFFSHVGIYAGFTFVAYLILRRIVVSDFLFIGLLGFVFLSFAGAGFLLALAYHVFPTAAVYTFTPAVDLLFAPTQYFFWWFIAPIVGLFFLAR